MAKETDIHGGTREAVKERNGEPHPCTREVRPLASATRIGAVSPKNFPTKMFRADALDIWQAFSGKEQLISRNGQLFDHLTIWTGSRMTCATLAFSLSFRKTKK
ncbi:hypothetical protein HPP92_005678 [Vanilla planifolia]|uniref:Uncharacterized protein n=1 Tax=Vanilla planifolia TaxID=51239 RepID=A0A835VCU4_VANPL|nr:hypothetical protein HPP92_005678 [Vanilla planifolia]